MSQNVVMEHMLTIHESAGLVFSITHTYIKIKDAK